MKIKKEKLIGFLNKVKLSGTDELSEVIFNFSEEGLNIDAVCAIKTSMVKGILKKEVFDEYEVFNEIGIMNLPTAIRVIDTFNEDLNISIEGNLLIVKEGKRKVEVEYADPSVITKTDINLDIEFEEQFKIDISKINAFIDKAAGVNKDLSITLTTSEGKLTLKNSGTYKFTEEIAIEGIAKDVSITFGASLKNVIASLSGEVLLCMKSDTPMKIEEDIEGSNIELITSPFTDNW